MLSTCTKEFTKELDGDDRNEMFDDDSSVSLAVTEVVRSLKSIGHLLTNCMSLRFDWLQLICSFAYMTSNLLL